MLLNCGVGEDSWESLGLQDHTSQSYREVTLNIFGRTEAEAPILWPPDAENWLIGTDPDAGKDWKREEKGTTEDEMVEWHHQLDGHEFEQALGDVKYREAWCAAVHGVTKSRTQVSDWKTTTTKSTQESTILCMQLHRAEFNDRWHCMANMSTKRKHISKLQPME